MYCTCTIIGRLDDPVVKGHLNLWICNIPSDIWTKVSMMDKLNPSTEIDFKRQCIICFQKGNSSVRCIPSICICIYTQLSFLFQIIFFVTCVLLSHPLAPRWEDLFRISLSPCCTQRRREIIVRGQSYFSRLPKYWPPIPLSARRVCTPRLCCRGEDQKRFMYRLLTRHGCLPVWLVAAWYSSGNGHGPTWTSHTDVGVLKKLSLADIAKLSRLKYRWLRFVWPEPTIGWCTQPVNLQLILQSSMKYLGLAGST